MKKVLFILAALFLSNNIIGQDSIQNVRCEFDPNYYLNKLPSLKNARIATFDPNKILFIPVVVHIYHLGESIGTGTNISDEAVYNAIQDLNDNYRARGIYTTSIDTKIQFYLANINPTGQTTTGIIRVNASSIANYSSSGCDPSDNTMQNALRNLSSWNSDYYINIRSIKLSNANLNFAYGLNDAFIDFNEFQYGVRTLIPHEIGHVLTLAHTFQGDNWGANCPTNNNPSIDGDGISDTEPHKFNDYCFNKAPTDLNPCTGLPFGKLLMNTMSYGVCKGIFTPKQIERMRNAISEYRSNWVALDPTARIVNNSQIVQGEFTQLNLEFSGNSSWNYSLSNGLAGVSNSEFLPLNLSPSSSTLIKVNSISNSVVAGTPVGKSFIKVIPNTSPDIALINLEKVPANFPHQAYCYNLTIKNISSI
jgi:hypothetical protein